MPLNPIEVDARGLRCPLPVIRLAEAARDAPAGTLVVILASDPAARHDIPAWCRLRNHELCEMTEVPPERGTRHVPDASGTDPGAAQGGEPVDLRFVVRLRPQPPKARGTGRASARPSRKR